MSGLETPRTDLSAHSHAMELPIADVVSELIDLLGATTVAVIGGVRETRAVQQWTNGREPQRQHVLRFALQLRDHGRRRIRSVRWREPGFTAAIPIWTTRSR